jgi:hypothetical protein
VLVLAPLLLLLLVLVTSAVGVETVATVLEVAGPAAKRK